MQVGTAAARPVRTSLPRLTHAFKHTPPCCRTRLVCPRCVGAGVRAPLPYSCLAAQFITLPTCFIVRICMHAELYTCTGILLFPRTHNHRTVWHRCMLPQAPVCVLSWWFMCGWLQRLMFLVCTQPSPHIGHCARVYLSVGVAGGGPVRASLPARRQCRPL